MKGALLSVILLITSFSKIYACAPCKEISLKQAYHKSDLIVTAKLIKKELKMTEVSAPKIELKQLYTRAIFTFEIIETIKGVPKSKIITITSKYKNIDFERGEKYLIYAYFSEYLLTNNFYLNGEKVTPFLSTNKCTKTKHVNFIEKNEIKKLKKFAKRERN